MDVPTPGDLNWDEGGNKTREPAEDRSGDLFKVSAVIYLVGFNFHPGGSLPRNCLQLEEPPPSQIRRPD